MARVRKAKSTAPDGFPDKLWNKLGADWRNAAQSKQTEDLEKEIIKSVRTMSGLSFDMKQDEKLEALVKEARELKSFYTDSIAIEKAKLDFCVYLMNTRGTKVSQSTDSDTDSNEKAVG